MTRTPAADSVRTVLATKTERRADLAVLLLLSLLPALLLHDSVFLGKRYLPFDLAEYPPIATTLSETEVEALRLGANYDSTEPPVWFVPELQLARQALARGQFPHWNPYVRGGAPLAAHGHMGLLDPLHWPALLCADPVDGLLYLTYTMLALAGILMYGLLRALALRPLAACFGAVAFAWSGTMTANGHWFQRLEPLALLPGLWWAELALSRARGSARALPAAALALGIALCWLAGFPPFCIPVSLLAAAFGLLLVLRRARDPRDALHVAMWLLAAAAVGLLLAAPQVLLQVQFFQVSNRTPDPTLASISRFAYAPGGLLGYLFPELFSHPSDAAMPGERAPLAWLWSDLREWGTGRQLLPNYNFTEYAVFPGTLPLLFAVLALLLPGPRWRWLALATLASLWCLATGFGAAKTAFALPVVKTVPPYRFAGPCCALIAMLAACGFAAVQRIAAPWLLRGLCVLLVGGAAWCLGESTHAVPAVTLADDPWVVSITERYREPAAQKHGVPPAAITADLVLSMQFQTRDPQTGAVQRDLIRLARERLHQNLWRTGMALVAAAVFLFAMSLRNGGRVLAGWPSLLALLVTAAELLGFGHALNQGRELPHAHDSDVHRFLRDRRDAAANEGSGFLVARGAGPHGLLQLPGGTLAKDRIPDLHFYTFVDGRSGEPIRRLYGESFMIRDYMPMALPDDPRLELPFWDMIGLRYVLTTQPMQHAGDRVGPELRGPGGEFFVYERPHPRPRAWVVHELRIVDDDDAAITAVLDPAFDPARTAVVTRAQAAALPAATSATSRARIARCEPIDDRQLLVHVPPGPTGHLVVADTWLPGWTARIDGVEVPLVRGNGHQRIVALPTNGCTVSFRYVTPGFVPGLGCGAAGVLALVALVVAGRRGRRRPVV